MNTQTTEALLRQQPFVRGLQDDEIGKLAALAQEARFEREEVLFGEGHESKQFYLILSGSVGLEMVPPTGAVRLDTLSAGDELGFSSVMGRDTVFQARALSDLHLLAFDAARLRALCEADTDFGYKLMQRLLEVVSDRLQVTRVHLMDSYWPVARRAGA